MLREGDPLGVIVVGWVEAGPVPKVQEELLKTFADQAVIAIENVRLFSELRESSGSADGDIGGVGRHQLIARRAGTGIPGDARERDAHL